MIVAKISGIPLTEEVVQKGSDTEKDLHQRLAAVGFSLSYPILETDEGDVISQSTAICQLLAEMGSAPYLLGSNAIERAQVDQMMDYLQN